MGVPAGADYPQLRFEDRKAFEKWLAANHAKAAGIWMEFAKKGSASATLSYVEAVEVALCYGWIDGQARPVDDEAWLQKYTPRRARSRWSKINRGRAESLIAAKKMKAPGLAEVDAAKADGRWDAAYASPSQAETPEDFESALKKNAKARRFFETLNKTNRYAIYYRIQDAKRPETRAKRIAQFVDMLARGEKLHP